MKKSAYSFLMKNKDIEPILNYIYDCFNNDLPITIQDVSEHCYISKAGITRFFQSFGFEGFKEFKYLLLNERKTNFEIDQNILASEFDEEVFLHPYQKAAKLNEISLFETALQLLNEAKMIYLLGCWTINSFCWETSLRLQALGYPTINLTSLNQKEVFLTKTEANDVLLVLYYSETNKELFSWIKNAKKNGTKIILISKNQLSDLMEFVDLYFKLDVKESLLSIDPLKEQVGMTYIIFKLLWYISLNKTKSSSKKLSL